MQQTPPHLNSELAETLATCKRLLVEQYGDRLQALILFGSAARQSLTSDSDLDLLVVLKPPFDYFQELHTLVDVLYPLQLESSHWISAKPASQAEFISGATQLYRNVQQEGILL
jgi:predicted nucleotidyltransferase